MKLRILIIAVSLLLCSQNGFSEVVPKDASAGSDLCLALDKSVSKMRSTIVQRLDRGIPQDYKRQGSGRYMDLIGMHLEEKCKEIKSSKLLVVPENNLKITDCSYRKVKKDAKKGKTKPEKVNIVLSRYSEILANLERIVKKTECNPVKTTLIVTGCTPNTNGEQCINGNQNTYIDKKEYCCKKASKKVSPDNYCDENEYYNNLKRQREKPKGFIGTTIDKALGRNAEQ